MLWSGDAKQRTVALVFRVSSYLASRRSGVEGRSVLDPFYTQENSIPLPILAVALVWLLGFVHEDAGVHRNVRFYK
jgi:hypothetical protein